MLSRCWASSTASPREPFLIVGCAVPRSVSTGACAICPPVPGWPSAEAPSRASPQRHRAARTLPPVRIGFAGLGAMGAGIADRLRAAGRDVTGWNRTKARAQPLLDAGMGWAETPRELAARVDVLFTMLTNTAAIVATADGEDGVLAGVRPGTVWADISTIAPDASVALAERVRETGASFLDCPVSGSPATLAAGEMSVMVGGEREAFDHVAEVLRAIGPKVTYIGPNGQAILTKVAINLALVVSVTA